jgi:endo-1,4-beta-xylanase
MVVMAWLGIGVANAGARVIPEGSSLWFACTEATFNGPHSLDCPQSYTPQYLSTFLGGFSRFTPENEFQMVYLEPKENEFDFSVADQVAQFAVDHNMTIRGHALLWWGEEPYWLAHPLVPWLPDELQSVMRTYITKVVAHFADAYPGRVPEWDVVNEPLDGNGNLFPDVWLRTLGPSYIAEALNYAHAADPAANLVINDEGAGAPGPETTGMLNLATHLLHTGVPLNTIGFEAHVNPQTAATLPQLLSTFNSFAALGLKVEITELDVSDYDGIDHPAAKAAVFETYAKACELAPNCTGYTVWGVANRYSWLGADTDDLLYGDSFTPTPAVSVVQKDLAGLVSAATAKRKRPNAARAKTADRRKAKTKTKTKATT